MRSDSLPLITRGGRAADQYELIGVASLPRCAVFPSPMMQSSGTNSTIASSGSPSRRIARPLFQCARYQRRRISLKFYQVNASLGGPKCDIDQVAVMGEDDYLRFGCELRQRGKTGPGAVVVPVDE